MKKSSLKKNAKKEGVIIELDRPRRMIYTVNVMEKAADRFAGVKDLSESFTQFIAPKHFKWLIAAMCNETAEEDGLPEITEQQVGRYITMDRWADAAEMISDAVIGPMREKDPEYVAAMEETVKKNLREHRGQAMRM